jgi:hypothetical protein
MESTIAMQVVSQKSVDGRTAQKCVSAPPGPYQAQRRSRLPTTELDKHCSSGLTMVIDHAWMPIRDDRLELLGLFVAHGSRLTDFAESSVQRRQAGKAPIPSTTCFSLPQGDLHLFVPHRDLDPQVGKHAWQTQKKASGKTTGFLMFDPSVQRLLIVALSG